MTWQLNTKFVALRFHQQVDTGSYISHSLGSVYPPNSNIQTPITFGGHVPTPPVIAVVYWLLCYLSQQWTPTCHWPLCHIDSLWWIKENLPLFCATIIKLFCPLVAQYRGSYLNLPRLSLNQSSYSVCACGPMNHKGGIAMDPQLLHII